MPPELSQLLLLIEQKLDWGASSDWQTRDFDKLHEVLFEKTGVSLSNSTLRRVWGKVSYGHMPSAATLDALSVFAGYESWRAFNRAEKINQPLAVAEPVVAIASVPAKKRSLLIPYLSIGLVLIIVVVYSLFSFKPSSAPDPSSFVLHAKRITDKIPNSVVFTYDAAGTKADSVFIQQSWDTRTRTAVSKTAHTFTSLYYEPGFFHAKLFTGSQLAKEDTVMIPTKGWTGLIRQFPVPVYLDQAAFLQGDRLEYKDLDFEKKGLGTQSPLPFTIYANVGNMVRVPANDFNFHADIRSGYRKGTGICQQSFIGLLTDGAPIFIPLCDKGCISDLKLVLGDSVVSGKSADLSGFGADMSSWVSVDCKATAKGMTFFINGQPAYTTPFLVAHANILGLVFMFRGTGGAKNISLSSGNRNIFSAFTPVTGQLTQVDKR